MFATDVLLFDPHTRTPSTPQHPRNVASELLFHLMHPTNFPVRHQRIERCVAFLTSADNDNTLLLRQVLLDAFLDGVGVAHPLLLQSFVSAWCNQDVLRCTILLANNTARHHGVRHILQRWHASLQPHDQPHAEVVSFARKRRASADACAAPDTTHAKPIEGIISSEQAADAMELSVLLATCFPIDLDNPRIDAWLYAVHRDRAMACIQLKVVCYEYLHATIDALEQLSIAVANARMEDEHEKITQEAIWTLMYLHYLLWNDADAREVFFNASEHVGSLNACMGDWVKPVTHTSSLHARARNQYAALPWTSVISNASAYVRWLLPGPPRIAYLLEATQPDAERYNLPFAELKVGAQHDSFLGKRAAVWNKWATTLPNIGVHTTSSMHAFQSLAICNDMPSTIGTHVLVRPLPAHTEEEEWRYPFSPLRIPIEQTQWFVYNSSEDLQLALYRVCALRMCRHIYTPNWLRALTVVRNADASRYSLVLPHHVCRVVGAGVGMGAGAVSASVAASEEDWLSSMTSSDGMTHEERAAASRRALNASVSDWAIYVLCQLIQAPFSMDYVSQQWADDGATVEVAHRGQVLLCAFSAQSDGASLVPVVNLRSYLDSDITCASTRLRPAAAKQRWAVASVEDLARVAAETFADLHAPEMLTELRRLGASISYEPPKLRHEPPPAPTQSSTIDDYLRWLNHK